MGKIKSKSIFVKKFQKNDDSFINKNGNLSVIKNNNNKITKKYFDENRKLINKKFKEEEFKEENKSQVANINSMYPLKTNNP
jgi:hypothetical protein